MSNPYIISDIRKDATDVYIFHLKPREGEILDFTAGQFCQLTDRGQSSPKPHFFSIASSPSNKQFIEIAIKIYGPWTQAFCRKKIGDEAQISGPFGRFTWEENLTYAVFLAGGIGVTPLLSILRNIVDTKLQPRITLLYGNRTEDTIAYDKELQDIETKLDKLKIVHILSHLDPREPWAGYRGFITNKILLSEVELTNNPRFFICGPPIFIKLMNELLLPLGVSRQQIKQELFT